MTNTVVIIVVVVAVVVAAVAIAARARRSNDGVDSFRRQIDALSPEARRPVIDQVQSAAGRHPDEDAADDEPDDEDGARGT